MLTAEITHILKEKDYEGYKKLSIDIRVSLPDSVVEIVERFNTDLQLHERKLKNLQNYAAVSLTKRDRKDCLKLVGIVDSKATKHNEAITMLMNLISMQSLHSIEINNRRV